MHMRPYRFPCHDIIGICFKIINPFIQFLLLFPS